MFNKCAKINNSRGLALFIVIVVIFLVWILAAAVCIIMQNNTKQIAHRVNRIKAEYAVKGAMVYTFEQLRQRTWAPVPNVTYNYGICPAAGPGCTLIEPDFIAPVYINIGPAGSGIAGTRRVRLAINYPSPTD